MEKKVQLKLEEYRKEYDKYHKAIEDCKTQLAQVEKAINETKANIAADVKKSKNILDLLKGKSTKSMSDLLAQKEVLTITLKQLEVERTNEDVIKAAINYVNAVESEISSISEYNKKQMEKVAQMEKEIKELRMKHGYEAYIRVNRIKSGEVRENLKDILDTSNMNYNTSISDIKNILENR